MDAAIASLEEHGVLAGLNLAEVAASAGVTPANIYHLFGSRRQLLREALRRETVSLVGQLGDYRTLPFADRRLATFDQVQDHPGLALTVLPAIDGDPEFRPMPFIETALADYARMREDGSVPGDVDVEALHLISLAVSIGVAVYGESAARQLAITTEELRDRVRSTFGAMLRALVE